MSATKRANVLLWITQGLIMSGAVTVTLEGHMYGPAVVPLVVGALAATIAVRRRERVVAPARGRTEPRLRVKRAA